MDIKEILERVDHTVLTQTATWEEIRGLCDDGMRYGTASVCIPPCYVKQAAEYIRSVNGELRVCTVIGFPNGYSTTAVKCFEAKTAVDEGADEIDMVINIGWVKDGLYDKVLDEIKQIKAACCGRLLKVIIETCLLTEEEKLRLCKVVSESGAEYIKTSTGFSKAGATFEDVKLMADNVDGILVKAAGGISSIDDAERFIALGASRLGTSRIVKLVKAEQTEDHTY